MFCQLVRVCACVCAKCCAGIHYEVNIRGRQVEGAESVLESNRNVLSYLLCLFAGALL